MSAPVVILAVGNPSRGDDAIGPELCGRLAVWLEIAGLSDAFELIEDFQLNIEHALDLRGRRMALFIDAGERTPGPFCFKRIEAQPGFGHSTHALPPESVLQVYRQTEDAAPPPAYVLCVRGEQFELGEPLSPAAEANLQAALVFLQAQAPAWAISARMAASTAHLS